MKNEFDLNVIYEGQAFKIKAKSLNNLCELGGISWKY